IIQDCAHSFAVKWKEKPVQKEGIAALFGLNISKTLTSIFGGMITTDNEDIYQKLKTIRNQKLKRPGWGKIFRRLFYFLALYPSFWGPVYGLINCMERSGMLNCFVRYYDESKIDMPVDYMEGMCGVEARIGSINVDRYEAIISRRRAAAKYYFDNRSDNEDFKMPPMVTGATYSHFVVQIPNREKWLQKAIQKGVQLGWLIEYNIPEMKVYGGQRPEEFPVAADYARTAINLPVYGGAHVARKVVRMISPIIKMVN
ncbi:MAG: DegT/DnrJ/EryC1/StrS family aminotransferase, partial [Candidatus Omnitrophica bacterium]|nr:DegT/DnrJ/EryC1/StrS family aminotransferase [Candidatus Omnitrophota bacterium]